MPKLSKIALPVLSAMVLLSLTGGPSGAQAPTSLGSKRAPGQVAESIGKAAAIVETVPYQATLNVICADRACTGSLPKVGARRRLNIMRVTCLMGGSTGSTYSTGQIQLIGGDNSPLFQIQFLPLGHSADHEGIDFTFHTVNSAVDMRVSPRQHIKVSLYLGSGTAKTGMCSASGTLDVF
jgi:hypothetical protein